MIAPVTPTSTNEVFLRPGEFYFGNAPTRIRTLLGSCIAITLWHPKLKIGGMCHYMLSSPSPRKQAISRTLDGRYAEDAVELFLAALQRTRTQAADYHVKVFGGGNMFPHIIKEKKDNISEKNIEIIYQLLNPQGFRVQASHLGGAGYRRIVFDISTGVVQVYHQPHYGQPFNGTI